MGQKTAENTVTEWVSFPGGELEGKRPKALCAAFRDALRSIASLKGARPRTAADRRHIRRTLCFLCYRAQLDRERALGAAGQLETASSERFQFQLPLEPVDRPRLAMLKAERTAVRVATTRHSTDRRRAQIEARHALQQISVGLKVRGLTTPDARERTIFQAVHAAELQLPESWLPFVIAG
jgi:hypothetical protein